jgi:hypothetical protein
MTDRERYAPGSAREAHVRKGGEKWTLTLCKRIAPAATESLAGANRSGASARLGFLRRRWEPGYRWNGEAHHGGSASDARSRGGGHVSAVRARAESL